MTKGEYKLNYIILIAARLVSPFLIFVNPLLAVLFMIVFDAFDGLYAARGGIKSIEYQHIDKTLDLVWYTITFALVILDPRFYIFRELLALLYAYRLFGFFVFLKTHQRKLFLLFANFYENVFILILIGVIVPQLSFLIEPPFLVPMFALVIMLKLIQEYIAHFVTGSVMERYFDVEMKWAK